MKTGTFLAITACLLCTACGFEPMYGSRANSSVEQAGVQDQLSQIAIDNIPNWEGQYLRNELIDRFYKDARPADPAYTLKISPISESTYDLDITITSDATRAQLNMQTVMNLVDNTTGMVILTSNIKAIASYNIMDSRLATRVSEQNTRKNVLNDLARQIELQIVLHMKRK